MKRITLKAGRDRRAYIRHDHVTNGHYSVHRDALTVVFNHGSPITTPVPAYAAGTRGRLFATYENGRIRIGCYQFGVAATRILRRWATE